MARQVNKDVTRLPKWAQDEIATLKRQADELSAQLERVSNPHPNSNVRVSHYGMHPEVTLPQDSLIDFHMPRISGRVVQPMISVRHDRVGDGDFLAVSSNTGKLIIESQSGNTIRVYTKDR